MNKLMNKREMIRIHLALAQVKLFLEEHMGMSFCEYDELQINPFHAHKSRKEHRKAILILCSEISSALSKYRERASSIAEAEQLQVARM